jgi:hypothetical protein
VAGTVCCLRTVAERQYNVAAGLTAFVHSSTYTDAAPQNLCDGGVFTDQSPPSDVVEGGSLSDIGTHDYVTGPITGMPNSEVKFVELIDLVTRRFKLKAVFAEDDVIAASSTVFAGRQGVSYAATFFIGMANFQGTGTSSLNSQAVPQTISVSKSNLMTLSTYGATQDPLLSYTSMSLSRVAIANGFAAPNHLYWLTPFLVVPGAFSGRVPLISILVGKSIDGAAPTEWFQVPPAYALVLFAVV